MVAKASKAERHRRLLSLISEDPLLTDDVIADQLGVSVQTIRLDRLELGVPQMRVRARQLAERAKNVLRAIGPGELTGELVDVELGRRAVSVLETTKEMGFHRSQIVRGHHIFAQANSLAVAVIDADAAVTGSARLKYHEPVRVGSRIVAKAIVRRTSQRGSLVIVGSRVGQRLVFSGRFVVFPLNQFEEAWSKGGQM